MSGSNEVRVTVTADASNFNDATKGAADSAQQLTSALTGTGAAIRKIDYQNVTASTERARLAIATFGTSLKGVNPVWLETGQGAMRLADAMNEAGGSLRKLTPEMLGLGSSTNAMYGAIAKATEAQRAKVLVTEADTAASARLAEGIARGAAAAGISVEQFTAEAQAIAQTRMAAEAAGAELQALLASTTGTAVGLRNAEDSAHRFVEALNPTPLTMLRTLFNGTAQEVEALRASLVQVTTASEDAAAAFTANIRAIVGQRAAAAEAAVEFRALTEAFGASGSGVDTLRTSYAGFWQELGRTTSSQSQLIAKMEELNDGGPAVISELAAIIASLKTLNSTTEEFRLPPVLRSASEAAADLLGQLNIAQLTTFRGALNDVSTSAERMRAEMANGGDSLARLVRDFLSSGESAETFLTKLDRGRLIAFRDSLGLTETNIIALAIALREAAEGAGMFALASDAVLLQLVQQRQAAADAAAGFASLVDAFARSGSTVLDTTKSYTDFWHELGRVDSSQADLIKRMNELNASLVDTSRTIHDLIAVNTQIDREFKSAADSAEVFARALGDIISPEQRLRTLMESTTQATHLFGLELATTARGSLQFNQGVKSAADSAAFFEQQLDGVQTPLQKMRHLLGEDVPDAAKNAQHSTSMVTMEFIRLGHEGLVGNWTHIPGSLLVLTEYSDTARNALKNLVSGFSEIGIAAGIGAGAAVAALAWIAKQAYETQKALNDVSAAAVLMGRSATQAIAAARAQKNEMEDAGVPAAQADKMNSMIARQPGLTEKARAGFASLAAALRAAYPEEDDPEKYLGPALKATESVDGIEKYLKAIDQLTPANLEALEGFKATGRTVEATSLLQERLTVVLHGQIEALAKRKQMLEDINVPGLDAPPVTMGMLPKLKLPQSDLPEAKASSPEELRQAEREEEILKPMRERQALQSDINDLTAKVNDPSTAPAELDRAREALQIAKARLEQMRDPGDVTLQGKQEAALNDLLLAAAKGTTDQKQMAESLKNVRISYWEEEAAKEGQSAETVNRERQNANKARLGLYEEDARAAGTYSALVARQATLAGEKAMEEADKEGKGKVASREAATRAEFEVFDAASKDMTRQGIAANTEREDFAARAAAKHMELIRQEGAGETTYRQQIAQQAIAAGEQAMIAADKAGKDKAEKTEAATRAEFEVYDAAAKDMTRTSVEAYADRAEFAQRASEKNMELIRQGSIGETTYRQQIAQKAIEAGEKAMIAADAQGKKTAAIQEAATRAEYEVYRAASEDMTRVGRVADSDRLDFAARASERHMALMKEENTAASQAAKQQLTEWLTMMHEKENAAHDNFAKVEAIQQQIVDRLRGMGAAETKDYEAEKSRQDTILREHADKLLSLTEQTQSKQRQIDSSDIAFKRAQLDEEVALQRMSKSQEIAILTAYTAEKHTAELTAMTGTLESLDKEKEAHAAMYAAINISNQAGMTGLATTLGQQTIQWTDYYNKIRALQQQWLTEDMKANEQALADKKAKWEAMTAPISSAIDSQVSAVMRGNETIGQATGKMLQDILAGYVQMGVKKLIQLASDRAMEIAMGQSTEAAKTAIQQGGATARTAISTTEAATQNSGILASVARWLFGESAKTAATVTNTTAQTGAVTAGVVAQQAAKDAGAAAGSAQEIAVGTHTVMNAAYKAAANTYASVAAIPYVGPFLAPAAAAGAFTAVMAFDSITGLETGTYNVPQNMLANLHAGEMVVPETFASGIRGVMGRGGAGDGGTTQNLTYAPHVNASNADLTSTMRQQAASMKSFMWHATRNGALALPGRG